MNPYVKFQNNLGRVENIMDNREDWGLKEAIDKFEELEQLHELKRPQEPEKLENIQMPKQPDMAEESAFIEDGPSNVNKKMIIIAIVAAVVVIAGIIAAVLFMQSRNESQTKKQAADTKVEEVEVNESAPEVTVNDSIQVMARDTFTSDQVITAMDDEDGIASVAFRENGTAEGVVGEDGVLTAATGAYDTVGTMTNAVIVTDVNGNVTEKEFTVEVVENIVDNTQGIGDKTYTVGSEGVDFMADIIWNEKIQAVTCDSSQVNLGAVGQYPLIYSIIANDANPDEGKEPTIKVVTVIANVVDAAPAEAAPVE